LGRRFLRMGREERTVSNFFLSSPVSDQPSVLRLVMCCVCFPI
jgi:hypothetical protein